MNTQDSGGAAGRENAPEGKYPDGPGPGGAAAEGKDGWEGGGGDEGGWAATEARYDTLGGMMKEDAFDINETECMLSERYNLVGPEVLIALHFALGGENEPHDEKAVKLVLGAPGVDVNVQNHLGQSVLLIQCSWGKSRNLELLLADPRVDVNQVNLSTGSSPLYIAANVGNDRCLALLLADDRVDVCRAGANEKTPLLSACIYLMTSMDQVSAGGGNHPARCHVRNLKSRRHPQHTVE
jgi:hypothetical protein